MIEADKVTGAVLAGGKSSRMTRDKALLPYEGKTFLQTLVDMQSRIFASVCIVADRQEKYLLPGVQVIGDIFPDAGPLAGIHAALTHARTPYVFITSCDTPRMRPSLVNALLHVAQAGYVTILHDGERMHPLIGLYPVSLLDRVQSALIERRLKVTAFLDSLAPHVTVAMLPQFRAMAGNINTPEEYGTMTHGARSEIL
jgi:molybdopterin-guanine dinucleotide biosynthesis protein A